MSLVQEYIAMRNNNSFKTEWFHKYWLENGGKQMSLNDFEQTFFYESIYDTDGKVVHRTLKDITPLVVNLDKKFNLTLLFANDGKFLKVVT